MFIRLQLLGNEVFVREQVIEKVGVEGRLVRELLKKPEARDGIPLFLHMLVRREVEPQSPRVSLEKLAPLVLLHGRPLGHERASVQIDDVLAPGRTSSNCCGWHTLSLENVR